MRSGRILGALVLLLVVAAGAIWTVMLFRLPDELSSPAAEAADGPAATPRADPLPPAAPARSPDPVEMPAPTSAPARPPDPSEPSGKRVEAPEPKPPTLETRIDPPTRHGPVEELEAAFASEPRDADSYAFEEAIESTFERYGMGGSLLEWAECHQSVCRIDTRWTPERAEGFMRVFTTLLLDPEDDSAHLFESMMAVDPDEPRNDGVRPISVYVRRQR